MRVHPLHVCNHGIRLRWEDGSVRSSWAIWQDRIMGWYRKAERATQFMLIIEQHSQLNDGEKLGQRSRIITSAKICKLRHFLRQ